MCCHDWTPLVKLYGRYECTMCGAKGYNKAVLDNVNFKPEIVPYRCQKVGCENPAHMLTKYSGGFQGWCRDHGDQKKPKKWIEVKCPVCNAPGGGMCRKMNRRDDEAKYCRMKEPHRERRLAAKGEFNNLEHLSVT